MFLLINGTRDVKNRSNFGEVDVAPVPCLSPRPTSPHLPPADLGENMCRVSKRPALNYMRTCNHKVPTIVYIHLRSVNEKSSRINLKIISRARALLQIQEKPCAKFQKDRFEIVWEVAFTRYLLSVQLRSENDKVQKEQKSDKNKARIIWKAHAHLQTMEKTCAKFLKD